MSDDVGLHSIITWVQIGRTWTWLTHVLQALAPYSVLIGLRAN